MKLNYSNIYFIGIGGIGMSALARYFKQKNKQVAGYDKTETSLTKELYNEGIDVHYSDMGSNVKYVVGNKSNTLVVITPAVPANMKEVQYLKEEGYTIKKRAAVLGMLSAQYKTLAVAGTHGKTTTSTLLTHVLSSTSEKCNAFLGGISANFNSNLLLAKESPWMVVEADEYDRSFHQLTPYSSIITSTDADHLDIYKSQDALIQAFEEYAKLLGPKGKLIVHHSVEVGEKLPRLTYGINTNVSVDYQGGQLRMENGEFLMNVETPTAIYKNVVLGLPGIHNAENALSVIALCESIGVNMEAIQPALANFKGVKRRFERVFLSEDLVYIDDYAHHPTAIKTLVDSVKLIYKDLPIYLVFQPHLYSRTQDFMNEFATTLSQVEEVFLLPIYPAREEPIEGVNSEALSNLITVKSAVYTPDEVVNALTNIKKGVILTVGAGNVDRLVEPIKTMLS